MCGIIINLIILHKKYSQSYNKSTPLKLFVFKH